MRIFILVAGTGSRLYPLTKDTPKSLLDIGNGDCLLGRQLHAIEESGMFSDAVIITGYRGEQIESWLDRRDSAFPVRTLFNPFFASTNNLVSLWCARHLMRERDFAITNGDNLYQPGVLRDAACRARPNAISITLSHKPAYDDDDMKVMLDAANCVRRIGKTLPAAQASAESVGLAFIKGAGMRERFIDTLERLLRDADYLNRFWLETFNRLVERAVPVHTVDIHADDWAEMDFHPDIETLRQRLSEALLKTAAPAPRRATVNE